MEPNQQDFVQEWEEAFRSLFVIDEVRINASSKVGQFVFFIVVRTDTNRAVNWMRNAYRIRESLPTQSRAAKLKGKRLFGGPRRSIHNGLRKFVFDCIRVSEGIIILGTSSFALKNLTSKTNGGIIAVPGSDEMRQQTKIRGCELVLFLNLIKQVAIDAALSGQVDVVVDRSHQLGLAPVDRGVTEDQFETFGPDDLNVLVGGGTSDVICNCKFRLISVSDVGPFRDLLLIPDSIAYIGGYCGKAFEEVKEYLSSGRDSYYWQADMTAVTGWLDRSKSR